MIYYFWTIYFLIIPIQAVCLGVEKTQHFFATYQPYQKSRLYSVPNKNLQVIHEAIAKYSIRTPPGINIDLQYAPGLGTDRGRTIFSVDKNIKVLIGPNAFVSWGVLGSTLGHEIEVHCRQDLSAILRSGDKQLVSQAEQEAYLYEIKNRNRFALTSSEIRGILDLYRQTGLDEPGKSSAFW